jgi:O-antigen/teichoic acid export membrane protein
MLSEGPKKGSPGTRLMSPRAALSVANGVIGALLSTTALIFIAKNMGPDVMGVLGFAMATIGMLSFFSDFGFGSVHVLHIKSGEDVGKCVGAYAIIRLGLLGVFSLLTLTLIMLFEDGILGGEMEPTHALVNSMFVFLVYYVLLGVSQIATHTFDALGRSAEVYVPSMLELVVRVSFIGYIATSAYGSSANGPAFLASAYAAGIVSSTLLVALFMSNVPVKWPGKPVLKKYIMSLAPVFMVSMMIILDLFLDKAVVGYFWGMREVGLYFGVQRMAIFVGLFSLSVATLILPSVTTYFYRKDAAASWDVVSQAERYVSLVVIPTAAFYLLYGADIIRVFLTDAFVPSVDVMDVLVVSGTVVALVLPLRSSIAGVGKASTLFWIGMGGLGLQLLLLLLLVPDEFAGIDMLGLKGMGAALALLFCSIYYFFALRYMAWRTCRILPVAQTYRHIAAALVMVGAMYIVNWLIIPTIDWIALSVLAVVGILSYGIAAYLLGELNYSDYVYFRTMLNPQGTLQYVVHEILGRRAQ